MEPYGEKRGGGAGFQAGCQFCWRSWWSGTLSRIAGQTLVSHRDTARSEGSVPETRAPGRMDGG